MSFIILYETIATKDAMGYTYLLILRSIKSILNTAHEEEEGNQ
jgi:hypothetical protein